ncbi:sugar ABC transporter permease [Parafrigoribacterium mesophilum]|uniref:carbohydrate ABC transporter permease n=1 Tax=Parafrigoribacterium mesophilum TaxID=433646 RepID=UPI0031FD3E87
MSEVRVVEAPRRASVSEVRLKMADREGFLAWLFLVPTVVYIIALVGIPFALAIAFAFSDVTTGDSSFQWVGFKNFQLIFQDPVFWTSLWNTLTFTAIALLLIVVLGGLLAEILAADFRGKWIVRFLILLPWTTPVALSSVAWLWLLDSIYSPIDWVLRAWGLIEGNMYWLGEPNLAAASVIAVQVWRIVPLAAVIMLVGLLSIPKDIPEAARVDGAGYWRRMFEVTMPLTAPLIAVAALFGAIFIFTDMTVPYILTRGGPTNTTQVLASWSYVRGIAGGDIGQGAAIALFLFPLLLAAAVLILRSVRKMETLG